MPTTDTTDLTVANMILEQLGGRRFVAMTGATRFVGLSHALTFRLPGGAFSKGINYVKVTLTPMDEYTIEFGRIRVSKGNATLTPIETVEGVYNDNLREVFERATGLRTSL